MAATLDQYRASWAWEAVISQVRNGAGPHHRDEVVFKDPCPLKKGADVLIKNYNNKIIIKYKI